MKDNVYLDNAASTWPKPEAVYRHVDQFSRECAVNPGRSGHTMGVIAEQEVVATRRMLAAFFNFDGPHERVIFALNNTDAMNLALRGLLEPGDHLINTRLDHNASLRVANHLEIELPIELSSVAPGPDRYIDPAVIEQAIRPHTRAIVVNHASNVSGEVQAIGAIGELARRHGVKLIVDVAQTAGTVPIDMQATGIDMLVFTGHKGLFAPMGVGGLIVAEGLELKPVRVGGTGTESALRLQPERWPQHLEAGTLPLPAIAGLNAAQRWFRALGDALVAEPDFSSASARELAAAADVRFSADAHHVACRRAVEHIHAVEMRFVDRVIERLESIEGVRVLAANRADQRVATLSFVHDQFSAEQIATIFDADHGIAVRNGLHCAPLWHADVGTLEQGGTVRIAPGYFSDDQDLDQLFAALEAVFD